MKSYFFCVFNCSHMEEITIKNIQNVLTPEFIETLEHYYEDLIVYIRNIQTPITLMTAYEMVNEEIDNMNLTLGVADMLDSMMFNMLKHNAVNCIGLTELIIAQDIIIEIFNDLFIYTLTTMFNNHIEVCFEIIEDLDGWHMKATDIILTTKHKEKTYPLTTPLYVSCLTPYVCTNKNKIIGAIAYNEYDHDYVFEFVEEVD